MTASRGIDVVGGQKNNNATRSKDWPVVSVGSSPPPVPLPATILIASRREGDHREKTVVTSGELRVLQSKTGFLVWLVPPRALVVEPHNSDADEDRNRASTATSGGHSAGKAEV